ncbi:MAG: hypothetical protein AAGA48_31575 [Myxococcota bacterium]
MLVAIIATIAHAAPCDGPFGLDALLDDVSTIETALEEGRDVTAATVGVHLRDGLLCLDAPLPEVIAGRVLRAVGTGLERGGATEAEGWLRIAAMLSPKHTYPADHPSAEVWAAALEASSRHPFEPLPSHDLVAGEHYLDGRRLTEPGAEVGLPHLYQHQPPEGKLESRIIVGPAFPVDTVIDPTPPPPVTPVVPESRPLSRARWSPEKVTLVTGGSIALASAGVLLGLSTRTEGQFRQATTETEIDRYRDATNRLVIGSGASAGFGIVALSLGLLAGPNDAAVTPSFAFRF